MAINWSTLGNTIKDKYMDYAPAYQLGANWDSGIKSITGAMDMYNREQAIDSDIQTMIDAKKQRIQAMKSKLASLQDELSKVSQPIVDDGSTMGQGYDYELGVR